MEGLDAISDPPSDRQVFPPGVESQGGFVHDLNMFDPDYFHLSQRESEAMDPQHRYVEKFMLVIQPIVRTVPLT